MPLEDRLVAAADADGKPPRGRSGSETRRMTSVLGVRLPSGARALLERGAAAHGLTGGAFARAILCDYLGADLEDYVPTRPTRRNAKRLTGTARKLAETLPEIRHLREVVGELAGALVRAAVRTRAAREADLHAEVEAALPGVRAAAADLDVLRARVRDLLSETAAYRLQRGDGG